MKILVIGGSYFFGRWFVQIMHKEHDITVINRGNIAINLPGVTERKADRHNIALLKEFTGEKYDCIVDFCAYEEGDIRSIAGIFADSQTRYIFVSTIDVYKKHTGQILNEDSLLASEFPDGPEGDYIRGKVRLEAELKEISNEYGIKGISVRPAILYGPANYAPRESIYFDWIKNYGKIFIPDDSKSHFQMIYVKDAVYGLKKLCEMDKDLLYDAYNFCPEKCENYESFADALTKAVQLPFEVVRLSVDEMQAKGIPAPFPLLDSETENYGAKRFAKIDEIKTNLADGLKRSFY